MAIFPRGADPCGDPTRTGQGRGSNFPLGRRGGDGDGDKFCPARLRRGPEIYLQLLFSFIRGRPIRPPPKTLNLFTHFRSRPHTSSGGGGCHSHCQVPDSQPGAVLHPPQPHSASPLATTRRRRHQRSGGRARRGQASPGPGTAGSFVFCFLSTLLRCYQQAARAHEVCFLCLFDTAYLISASRFGSRDFFFMMRARSDIFSYSYFQGDVESAVVDG